MTETAEATATMILKDVPVELRLAFKTLCTIRGIPMKKRMLELMNDEVRRGYKELKLIKELGENVKD